MSKKFYQILIAVVVFLILGGLIMTILTRLKPEKEKEQPPQAKRYVNAEPIQYKNYNTRIKASGRVIAAESIQLSSEVQGKIKHGAVTLRKGASFRKGQILVNVVNEEVTYNLKSQKSRFLMSMANVLADLKLDFPKAYDQWKDFFNKIDVNKPMPGLPSIDNNQIKIFLSSRNILGEYYSIISLEKRVAKQTIRAPFDGSYTQVNMQEGSVINPGAVIANIINTAFYEIEVPVEKNEVRWLKTGQKAKVIPEEESSDTLSGTIARIAKFIDPKTQTIPVYVRIPPKHGIVYEGDYFECLFENIIVKQSMELPRSAVFNHNEVFIVKDGRLNKRTINIQKVNEKTLYFNGLDEGSEIVNEALINANENMKVEVIDNQKQQTL